MKIEDAQDMMRKVYLDRDRTRGVRGTLKRTEEEFAELTTAILGNENVDAVGEEVADVFAWLCSLSNLLDIDVSKAFYRKYSNVCSKCKQRPCACPPE